MVSSLSVASSSSSTPSTPPPLLSCVASQKTSAGAVGWIRSVGSVGVRLYTG